MLVVFIFGCLIPAAIRVIQKFDNQFIAAIVAIVGLRLVLGAYVATMTRGIGAKQQGSLGETLLD